MLLYIAVEVIVSTIRILNRMGLHTRNNLTDPLDMAALLIDQVESYGRYQFHHLECFQYGDVVTRSTIRHLLKFMDPINVEQRQSRRLMRHFYVNLLPNFMRRRCHSLCRNLNKGLSIVLVIHSSPHVSQINLAFKLLPTVESHFQCSIKENYHHYVRTI